MLLGSVSILPSGSQSFIKFRFDTFVEIDNTISENSNIIGVSSDSFFMRFFTQYSTFFLKGILVI